MKTTKKIFAAFIAVMMIALMIPFSASAASYSYSITGKDGYVFTVYKIATLNPTTFAFSDFASDDVKAVLTTKASDKGIDSAALLTAANSLTDAQLGSEIDTITSAAEVTKTVAPGVYYVKATTTPDNVTMVNNSVFSLPYNDEKDGTIKNTKSFDAGGKVDDKTPRIEKKFTDTPDTTSISEFIGNDISFTITSTITGSDTLKLKSYVITDTMSKGLDSATDKIVSVKLKGKDDKDKDIVKDLKVNTDYTVAYSENTENNTLTITMTDTILNGDKTDFYTYSDVEVIYTATLNKNAIKGYDPDPKNTNTNVAKLDYKTNSGNDHSLDTNTLKVYTFELPVNKADGNTNALITTSAAKFTLYTDLACTEVATNGTETATENGIATFTGLKAGTYYLKETEAPTGYNLNSSVIKVVISDEGVITVDNQSVGHVTVNDYPLSVPSTGGAGTVMFTVGGIALIACAGVLFLVVMRKKKTSK